MYKLLLAALVPLALGEYSYSYDETPTTAPTSETRTPTATAAPTRTETYAPTRMTEAPSYAPTTDTYAPTTAPTLPCDSTCVMTDSNIRQCVDAWLSRAVAAATYCDISQWETGEVTDMSYLFCGSSFDSSERGYCNTAAASFDDDITAWNTSGVSTMAGMFYAADSLDHPLGDWDVAKVTDIGIMDIRNHF